MNIGSLMGVILGAILAVLGGMATELWRQRRDRRVAARLTYQELLLNYGTILSFRMGDADRHVLDRLSDSAWRERSDKLTLVQSYEDFQRLWGIYQIFPTLSTIRSTDVPSPTIIDAVLDSLDDVLLSMGFSAGVSRQDLDQMREGNRTVRTAVDLSKEERIGAWQRNVMGRYLVLPVAGDLGITPQGDAVIFKQPSSTFSEAVPARTALGESTFLGVSVPSSHGRQTTREPSENAMFFGTPAVLKITGETTEDSGFQAFLSEHTDFDFVLVSFVLSFLPGRLKRGVFKAVDVSIELSSIGGSSEDAPIAWSMAPTAISTHTEYGLGAAMQVQFADMKFRTPIVTKSGGEAEQYLLATGEKTSNPRWRLRATPGQPIVGMQRFQLVVQIPKESHARARIASIARTGQWWRAETLLSETTFELPV